MMTSANVPEKSSSLRTHQLSGFVEFVELLALFCTDTRAGNGVYLGDAVQIKASRPLAAYLAESNGSNDCRKAVSATISFSVNSNPGRSSCSSGRGGGTA